MSNISSNERYAAKRVEHAYLALSTSFAEFESAARLSEPSLTFRLTIAISVAELLSSIATASRIEPAVAVKRRALKDANAASRICNEAQALMRNWKGNDAIIAASSAAYDRAFASWLAAMWKMKAVRSRGPRRHDAARLFVVRIALAYAKATGCKPTIVTTEKYTGPFADLLRAVDRALRPLLPKPYQQWPADLAAVAKNMKLELRIRIRHDGSE